MDRIRIRMDNIHTIYIPTKKCVFSVTVGQFLGFMIHERRIDVEDKSQDVTITLIPPSNKVELQSLIGKINYFKRFISKPYRRIELFMPLVKIKNKEFTWGLDQQVAFDNIKAYLVSSLVLVPPQLDKHFMIYRSVEETSIGSVLIRDFEGKERVVFYLSKSLLDAKTRYSKLEHLCLCLYFTCTKLWHYVINIEARLVYKADVIKHMLSAPIHKGRLCK